MTASAGRLHTWQEPDYRYGVGPLQMRVERVDRSHTVLLDGEAWCLVEGVEIGRNSVELGRREVLVRACRLPA